MKNAEMKVIAFADTDVIATSGECSLTSTTHYKISYTGMYKCDECYNCYAYEYSDGQWKQQGNAISMSSWQNCDEESDFDADAFYTFTLDSSGYYIMSGGNSGYFTLCSETHKTN